MAESIVVVAAHAFEARAAASVGRSMNKEPWGSWMLYRGEIWDMPYAVIRSGPGKVMAAAATAMKSFERVMVSSLMRPGLGSGVLGHR